MRDTAASQFWSPQFWLDLPKLKFLLQINLTDLKSNSKIKKLLIEKKIGRLGTNGTTRVKRRILEKWKM